jgi:U3 small nucleolar RNA-associated protein 21
MFNLQSGLLRQRFPARLTPAQAKRAKLQKASDAVIDISHHPRRFGLGEGKHSKPVSGLAVDGLNRIVISCGLDGKLKVSSADLAP